MSFLRLVHHDLYIVVRAEGDGWQVEVTDAVSGEPAPERKREALKFALQLVSSLRRALFFQCLNGCAD